MGWADCGGYGLRRGGKRGIGGNGAGSDKKGVAEVRKQGQGL